MSPGIWSQARTLGSQGRRRGAGHRLGLGSETHDGGYTQYEPLRVEVGHPTAGRPQPAREHVGGRTTNHRCAGVVWPVLDNRRRPELGSSVTGGSRSSYVGWPSVSSAVPGSKYINQRKNQPRPVICDQSAPPRCRAQGPSQQTAESNRCVSAAAWSNVSGTMLASLLAQTAPYGNVGFRRARRHT